LRNKKAFEKRTKEKNSCSTMILNRICPYVNHMPAMKFYVRSIDLLTL